MGRHHATMAIAALRHGTIGTRGETRASIESELPVLRERINCHEDEDTRADLRGQKRKRSLSRPSSLETVKSYLQLEGRYFASMVPAELRLAVRHEEAARPAELKMLV